MVLLTLRWQRPNWGVVVVGQVFLKPLEFVLSFQAYNASSGCAGRHTGNLYLSGIGRVKFIFNNHQNLAPTGRL